MAQLVLRPDAREQQEMRGSNSARTQDDFLTGDGKLLSTALHLDTDGFLAVEDDAVHHTVGPDRQVQPMPGLAEIAQGGTPADAVRIVAGHRTNASSIRVIMVWTVWKACGPTGVVEGPLIWQPLVSLKASDNDWTVGIMKVAVTEVRICLNLAEILKAMLKVPLIVTHRSPCVIIFRHTAQEHLAIDGTRSARHLAPRHHHLRRLVGRFANELPVMVTDHDVRGCSIAVLHFIRQLLQGRIIGSGLDEQHRPPGVFTEAGRDNGTG